MKKIKMFYVLLVCLFISCENESDVNNDLIKLKNERTNLQNEVQNLSITKNDKLSEISSLNGKLKELKIYESGRTPQYILKINLKQSHMSLDIKKHMKDAMNSIDFELPVDKDFYNSVSVGTNIVDNFRTGSFILNGSLGKWDMKIKGKEIR